MTLRPSKTTQKALISTTSRLVGEHETDGVLVAHAWPDFYDQRPDRHVEGPISRSAFVFAFETSPVEMTAGSALPDYSATGVVICSYLSVLFGKRFDDHGLFENSGFFHIPSLTQFAELCDPSLPQNSHSPRVDFSIPLNLVEIDRLRNLLFSSGSLDQRVLKVFQGASKFYLQGLQIAERDPEVAYLHLITAGEILSSGFDFDKVSLLDEETREVISRISEASAEGPELAAGVLTRLLQVKRRFVQTITVLVDDAFFNCADATLPFGKFDQYTFSNAIAAAYDLRSRYVHTGVPFGGWVSLRFGGMNNELHVGTPSVSDVELGKIIAKAPTYIGLERVMRYCLFRFAEKNGLFKALAEGSGSKRPPPRAL